jgi:hypothetical protein
LQTSESLESRTANDPHLTKIICNYITGLKADAQGEFAIPPEIRVIAVPSPEKSGPEKSGQKNQPGEISPEKSEPG